VRGNYEETFYLAAENKVWIPGGEFTINITVADPQPPATSTNSSLKSGGTQSEPVVQNISPTEGLSAILLLRSAKEITATGGEEISYKVGIKNTGTVAWEKRAIQMPDVRIASLVYNTHHSSWLTSTKLAMNTGTPVNPGGLEFIDFKFSAPNQIGKHTVRYIMAVNDTIVPDFFIDIPVTVTATSPDIINSPVIGQEDIRYDTTNYIDEPYIRVGVLIVDEETAWQVEVSCDKQWNLMGGDGALLGEMNANEHVTSFYKKGKYWFNRGKGLESTSYWIRFVPTTDGAICTVNNFDRRVTRKYTNPDNQFRNILELRYNDYKDRTWLINELPIEDYVAGLAETSNSSHPEYQKALITAARTYAYFHFMRGTKRAKEFFTISSTADDQVYNGYGHELRSPTIAKAAADTRGIIVTYDGEYALTPYYSRSDGRTRDWSEVWGGSVDWLKSVACPCDKVKGRQLWGHGVGMSATEALCMANEEEKTWDEILKYFYTGVELTKQWK
ncbi:MAG: SpoIID/LytB domain-containing protein, partial [Patescibacteria group bacterium]